MGSDGPRILATTRDGKIRLVRLANSNIVFEKHDGCDALGVEKWRTVEFGDGNKVAMWMRDWVIELVRERGQEQDREREDIANTQAG